MFSRSTAKDSHSSGKISMDMMPHMYVYTMQVLSLYYNIMECSVNHCFSCAAFWAGSRNFKSTKSRPCPSSFGAKSQGHPPHSQSSSTRRTPILRDSSGRDSIRSQQSPRKPLLEKRYRFSSVPTATSIHRRCTTTASSRKRCVQNVPCSSTPSASSMTQPQRDGGKVRKGHTTRSSGTPQVSSRRTSLVGVVNRDTAMVAPTSHRVQVSASFTLPRMGQRSHSGINNPSEDIHSRSIKKPYNYGHTHSDKLSLQSQRTTTARSQGADCGTVRRHNRLKKSASVDAVSVDKRWGCVEAKEWRGGECCCEDVEEDEFGMSVAGDTISIEGIMYYSLYSVHLVKLDTLVFKDTSLIRTPLVSGHFTSQNTLLL